SDPSAVRTRASPVGRAAAGASEAARSDPTWLKATPRAHTVVPRVASVIEPPTLSMRTPPITLPTGINARATARDVLATRPTRTSGEVAARTLMYTTVTAASPAPVSALRTTIAGSDGIRAAAMIGTPMRNTAPTRTRETFDRWPSRDANTAPSIVPTPRPVSVRPNAAGLWPRSRTI